MKRINICGAVILMILLVCFSETAFAQRTGENACSQVPGMNGVYRIDVERSDRLYSIIEEAASNVPFADQQQFFIDLAVRLTPPDLLAIECRGNRVSLGSSRSPRVEFIADGVTRNSRNSEGRLVRSRIALERSSLTFNSGGAGDDRLNFTFTPLENGNSLRVTRRIYDKELIEPVVIKTVYNKISSVARWDVFSGDGQVSKQTVAENEQKVSPSVVSRSRSADAENNEADALRRSLYQWIDATNDRNIERQMTFYMPVLKAFYLTRNTSRNAVRQEKDRAFAAARSIDIQAAEPEIIFQDGGRTAVMRFRKKYDIRNRSNSKSGEVIQELRWHQTSNG